MGSMKLIDRLDELRAELDRHDDGSDGADDAWGAWELTSAAAYPALREVARAAKFVSNSPDLKEHCPHLVKILNDTLKELDR